MLNTFCLDLQRSMLRHILLRLIPVLWQKLCFSKNFSVGPSTSAYLEAKLVKVGVNGKNVSNIRELPIIIPILVIYLVKYTAH